MAHGKAVVWSPVSYEPGRPWLWSRPIDRLFVAGGGFFLVAAVLVPLSLLPSVGPSLNALLLHLSVLVNYPHYTSTYQVIVRERERRPASFRTLLWSAFPMAALLVVAGRWPDLLWGVVVRGYLTWSAYHYAAQHFGIAAMYCARAGTPLGAREKGPLQAAFLGVGGFMMLMANTVGGDADLAARVVGLTENGGEVPIAGFPSWMYGVGLALVAASGVAFAVAERRFAARTGRTFLREVWMLFATNLAWFVVPNLRLPGGEGWMWPGLALCLLGLPPFFHGLQYMAVTGHRSRTTGPVRPIWLFAGLVAAGYLLFHGPVPLLPAIAPVDATRGILLLVSVINLHHFWMDGLIWRRARVAALPASPPVS